MDKQVDIFYKGQKAFLNIFSLWPQKKRWRRIIHQVNYVYVMGFWVLLFDLILVLHVVCNFDHIEEIVKGIFILATSTAHTTKLICVKLNNVAIEELFDRLDDEDFRPRDPEEEMTFNAACKKSRKQRDYYAALSFSTLTLLLVVQLGVDWTILPLSTFNPFGDNPGSPGYWCMYCYQCLALSYSCVTNIAFDSLCSSLFIFIKCQLDIFAVRIDKIGRGQSAGGSVEKELKQCIRFHTNIVELTKTVELLLCKPISVQIFCSMLVLTANFYAIAVLTDDKLNVVKMIIYQVCMLIQIFILCYFAGEVTIRSMELPHDLYKTSWMDWDRSNRRILLMFMQRLHSTLRIRTLNPSLAFDLQLFSSVG